MTALLLHSLTGLTQDIKDSVLINSDGKVVMDVYVAADLTNKADSFAIVSGKLLILEEQIRSLTTNVKASKKLLENTIAERNELVKKLEEYEKSLNVKSERIQFYVKQSEEQQELIVKLNNVRKKRKVFNTVIVVSSASIITGLIIALISKN